ncbi:unnamed protein product [Miscanthus lutarioriparius]|uniref:Retroviral polymerase SH3-like domain-containing protein n=1 Tax=Miscanthus lutarioriparius TaxID=422564 RepID=A0A811Q9F1_9POAL|nr:unnamed protein product [Miscanthus lutarioriparius]
MKFDLPLLNYDTRFSLWQVKMRGILAQTHDYDEALDSFEKRKAEWTPEEIHKDQKALALIQLHLHNDIFKMQMKMKLFTLKMEEDSVMSHIAEFKKIVADLVSMEEVYEALQSREKMRGMVQNDGTSSSSKGDALHKDDTFAAFKDWKVMIERQTERKLKVFGCTAYAHVDNGKLEPRAVKCLFLGYSSGVKGYKLWNPEIGKTFISRSVVFNESVMFTDSLPLDHVPEKELQRMRMQVEHVDDDTCVQVEPVVEHGDHDNDVAEDDAHDDVQQTPPILQLEEDLPIAQRKSKRTIAPPKRLIEECNLSYYALSCAEQVENVHEPATYKEAIRCGDTEN